MQPRHIHSQQEHHINREALPTGLPIEVDFFPTPSALPLQVPDPFSLLVEGTYWRLKLSHESKHESQEKSCSVSLD